jgi:uncharacterized protein YcbK (DUF882 family)
LITFLDYIGPHRDKYTNEMVGNATILLSRVNALMAACGFKTTVNSGWRPPAYNATIPNASPTSKHMTMQAIDLRDTGQIAAYLNENRQLLKDHGLWMEAPASTRGWCHLQSVPPKSGSIVFYP